MELKDMTNEQLLLNYYWHREDEAEKGAEAELLSRLDEGEKDAIKWANIAGAHQQQIEKLVDEIENSKCCGNCKQHENGWQGITCNLNGYIQDAEHYCDQWQSDNMTRKEREGEEKWNKD